MFFMMCLLLRMAESSAENVVPGSGLSQNGHISDVVGAPKRSSGSGSKGGSGGRLGRRTTLSPGVKLTGKG